MHTTTNTTTITIYTPIIDTLYYQHCACHYFCYSDVTVFAIATIIPLEQRQQLIAHCLRFTLSARDFNSNVQWEESAKDNDDPYFSFALSSQVQSVQSVYPRTVQVEE